MITRTFCLAAALVFAAPICSDADTILDLATANGNNDAPVTASGMINGAIFSFGQPNSGTGNWDPFVRIQGNGGNESGYNTDANSPGLDEKKGVWTHSALVGNMSVVNLSGTLYFEYLVDLNETQNDNGRRISLDRLIVFQGADTNEENTIDLFEPTSLGTVVFDMDAGMPGNTVLFNTFNGGSGNADYSVLIPVWAGADASKHMTFFTEFGNYSPVSGEPGFGETWTSGAGFEEWAVDPGRTSFINTVPEPSALMMLSTFVGLGAIRRRRVG